MNKERKEPTISGMSADHDEIAAHQKHKARSPAASPVSRAQAAAVPHQRPIVVRSKLAPFALFLAMAGLGFAGYCYWQLTLAQQAMVSAESRIAELEGKLELSDDESNASMTAMQAKLKWADSEIRKLWGVSYDRNRKAIAANGETLAAVKKKADGIDKKIQNALKNTNAEVKLLNDLIEAQQASMVDIDRKSLEQMTKVRELTDQLTQLQRAEEGLKQRIGTNEEAIKAIDGFRRSINQQLLQLRGSAG